MIKDSSSVLHYNIYYNKKKPKKPVTVKEAEFDETKLAQGVIFVTHLLKSNCWYFFTAH